MPASNARWPFFIGRTALQVGVPMLAGGRNSADVIKLIGPADVEHGVVAKLCRITETCPRESTRS
ncbi:hypothetical protein FQZ97_516190 [compost metagenome]